MCELVLPLFILFDKDNAFYPFAFEKTQKVININYFLVDVVCVIWHLLRRCRTIGIILARAAHFVHFCLVFNNFLLIL